MDQPQHTDEGMCGHATLGHALICQKWTILCDFIKNNENDDDSQKYWTSEWTDIVFNYSNVKLSDAMQKLLNCALNVALFPFQLDITQLLVDFNRFARAKIWQEYWFNREKEEEYTKPIFKSLKSNLPRNYCTPSGLKLCQPPSDPK